MATYVSHGSGYHFNVIVEDARDRWTNWTVNPNVKIGDNIVFYLKQPYSWFLAIGRVCGEIERLNNKSSQWHGDSFANIDDLQLIHPLYIDEVRKAFPDWGWPRMPQARVRVPDEYEDAFLSLLHENRGWNWETQDWENGDDEENYAGAGFGDFEQNRKVEAAAIDSVWDWYESKGWNVEDRQQDRCGYDLRCTKGSKEEHVEVKGVAGDDVKFIMTRKEREVAKRDPRFRLSVVVKALSDRPEHYDFFHDHFKNGTFKFKPISYFVELDDG